MALKGFALLTCCGCCGKEEIQGGMAWQKCYPKEYALRHPCDTDKAPEIVYQNKINSKPKMKPEKFVHLLLLFVLKMIALTSWTDSYCLLACQISSGHYCCHPKLLFFHFGFISEITGLVQATKDLSLTTGALNLGDVVPTVETTEEVMIFGDFFTAIALYIAKAWQTRWH